MKKLIWFSILLVGHVSSFACTVCKTQQPKIFQGITHGVGPQDDWDYLIIIGASLTVLVTFFYSVKSLVRPGEKSSKHIKYHFLS